MSEPKVIIPLDFASSEAALSLVEQLSPDDCRLKIGKEMFTREGPALVRQVMDRGFDVFLDLKFHDIPNTVARAVQSAADLGVWMVNVHALGGRHMLEAAREALAPLRKRPLLTAVTILTSMSGDDLREVGIMESPLAMVQRLANLAYQAGLDGVVCSAQEAASVKEVTASEFLTVTPGIRLAGSKADDQRRIMTPEKAIANGSDFLVIGRPITQADNPLAVLHDINQSIQGASHARTA